MADSNTVAAATAASIKKICSLCDSEPATKQCDDCKEHYCDGCDGDVHTSKSKLTHLRRPIGEAPSTLPTNTPAATPAVEHVSSIPPIPFSQPSSGITTTTTTAPEPAPVATVPTPRKEASKPASKQPTPRTARKEEAPTPAVAAEAVVEPEVKQTEPVAEPAPAVTESEPIAPVVEPVVESVAAPVHIIHEPVVTAAAPDTNTPANTSEVPVSGEPTTVTPTTHPAASDSSSITASDVTDVPHHSTVPDEVAPVEQPSAITVVTPEQSVAADAEPIVAPHTEEEENYEDSFAPASESTIAPITEPTSVAAPASSTTAPSDSTPLTEDEAATKIQSIVRAKQAKDEVAAMRADLAVKNEDAPTQPQMESPSNAHQAGSRSGLSSGTSSHSASMKKKLTPGSTLVVIPGGPKKTAKQLAAEQAEEAARQAKKEKAESVAAQARQAREASAVRRAERAAKLAAKREAARLAEEEAKANGTWKDPNAVQPPTEEELAAAEAEKQRLEEERKRMAQVLAEREANLHRRLAKRRKEALEAEKAEQERLLAIEERKQRNASPPRVTKGGLNPVQAQQQKVMAYTAQQFQNYLSDTALVESFKVIITELLGNREAGLNAPPHSVFAYTCRRLRELGRSRKHRLFNDFLPNVLPKLNMSVDEARAIEQKEREASVGAVQAAEQERYQKLGGTYSKAQTSLLAAKKKTAQLAGGILLPLSPTTTNQSPPPQSTEAWQEKSTEPSAPSPRQLKPVKKPAAPTPQPDNLFHRPLDVKGPIAAPVKDPTPASSARTKVHVVREKEEEEPAAVDQDAPDQEASPFAPPAGASAKTAPIVVVRQPNSTPAQKPVKSRTQSTEAAPIATATPQSTSTVPSKSPTPTPTTHTTIPSTTHTPAKSRTQSTSDAPIPLHPDSARELEALVVKNTNGSKRSTATNIHPVPTPATHPATTPATDTHAVAPGPKQPAATTTAPNASKPPTATPTNTTTATSTPAQPKPIQTSVTRTAGVTPQPKSIPPSAATTAPTNPPTSSTPTTSVKSSPLSTTTPTTTTTTKPTTKPTTQVVKKPAATSVAVPTNQTNGPNQP